MDQRPVTSRPHFSEEWLVAVLDSLSEGVIALDAGGRVLAANPAAEEILGFAISDKRYCQWDELALRVLVDERHESLGGEMHPVVRSLEDGEPHGPRLVGLRARDDTRWLALATHILPGDETKRGVVLSFQDVSDLTRAERELQRVLTLLRDFMSAASHDLRTPLATLTGMGEFLGDAWDEMSDDERRDAVEVMTRQGRRLTRLVDDLSVVARLEGGGLASHPERVSLGRLVDAALDGIGRADELHIDVPDGLDLWVDPDHGRRMVLNLVQNALKYGAPPFAAVASAVGDAVELAVTDHGPGVPHEFVPRLFERFSRVATDEAGGGTGLGLSIVAGLASLNGGGVRYEDGEDGGSRFVLRLPSAPGA
ncbi:MAG: PAS domain-containing sensor histidine kinase [Nitriliruptorales bacterium]